MALRDKRHLMDKKFEASIPCTGRPGIEHVWMEGHLSTNNQYMIHLCDRKGEKYIHGPVFMRPDEMNILREKIYELKRSQVKH